MFALVRKSLVAEAVVKNGPALMSISNITTITEDLVKFERPPGPKQWPVLGCLPSILTNKAFDKERIHLFWNECVKQYGPIFQLRVPGSPTLNFISSIEDIEKMYKTTFDNPLRPIADSFKVANQRCPSKFYKEGEYGLLNEQGDNWWRVRRQVQPHTMKPAVVAQYLPGMDQIAKEFVERVKSQRDDNSEVSEDFMKDIMQWSVENLALISYNKRIETNEEKQEILKAADTIFGNLGKLEYGLQLWRYIQTPRLHQTMKARDFMRRKIDKSVLQAKKSLEEDDLSNKKLNILEELLKTPELSHRDIVMFMLDFNMAGADTTAYTVSFVMYLLAINPEKQAILHQELDKVLGDGTGELTPAHLAKLTYTKAVVKETLRVFPVAMGVVRQLNNDEVFSGYKLPKGSLMFAMEYPNCYNEKLFYKPKEFLPERWFRSRPHGPIQNYASFSFSRGTRSCVGRRVSEQEIYTIIARLFHQHTLEWKYEKLNPKSHLLLHPDLPLKFTMKEREKQNV